MRLRSSVVGEGASEGLSLASARKSHASRAGHVIGLAIALGWLPFGLGACGESTHVRAPSADDLVLREDAELESVGISTTPSVRRAPPEFSDTDPSAVRLFFDVLAPYGTWEDDARLGLVWTPTRELVGDGFVPYATHGRWTHRSVVVGSAIVADADGNRVARNETVDDYVWVSDLAWGWVTFHYGRWTYAGDRGWAWVPGRRYAGSWVDWRVPDGHDARESREARDAREPREPPESHEKIVGWGPTPPSLVWRVVPGPRASRAVADDRKDFREATLVAMPFVAFATPYTYVRAADLFSPYLGSRLLYGPAALAVANRTLSAGAPSPSTLGLHGADAPEPPVMDRGLQQAWMLATPASASAVGAGPELGSPPRLRTFVTGGPRWAAMR